MNADFFKKLNETAKKLGIDPKQILTLINQESKLTITPPPINMSLKTNVIHTGREHLMKIRLDNRMKFELMMRDGRFLKDSSFSRHGSLFYFRDVQGKNYFIEYHVKNNLIRGGFLDDYKDSDLAKYRVDNPSFPFDDNTILLDGILVADYNSEKSDEEIDLVANGELFTFEVTVKNKGKKDHIVVLLCPEQAQNHNDIEVALSSDDGMPFGIVKSIKAVAHTEQLSESIHITQVISRDARNPPIVLRGIKNITGQENIIRLNQMSSVLGEDDVITESNLAGSSEFTIGVHFIYFTLKAGRSIHFVFYGDRLILKR